MYSSDVLRINNATQYYLVIEDTISLVDDLHLGALF